MQITAISAATASEQWQKSVAKISCIDE